MISKYIGGDIPQPLAELVELEARNSNRTVAQQLHHILRNRYQALHRICACGFFVYQSSDAHECAHCGKQCCSYCAIPRHDETTVCFECAKSLGIDVAKAVPFRVVEVGKL